MHNNNDSVVPRQKKEEIHEKEELLNFNQIMGLKLVSKQLNNTHDDNDYPADLDQYYKLDIQILY